MDGLFRDEYGQEPIAIRLGAEGRLLFAQLRGIEFVGDSFSRLRPQVERLIALDQLVHLDENGWLSSFSLICSMPVMIVYHGTTAGGVLDVTYVDGPFEQTSDEGELKLSLRTTEGVYVSRGDDKWFSFECETLQAQLPAGTSLKTCLSCRFSDYNPFVGTGLMGELACFVNSADEFKYARQRGKGFRGWHRNESAPEFAYVLVQEFHLCGAFEERLIAGQL